MDYAQQAEQAANAAVIRLAEQEQILRAQKFQQEQAQRVAEARRRAAVDAANRQAMQGRQR